MQIFTKLNDEILKPLNAYKDWVLSPHVQGILSEHFAKTPSVFANDKGTEHPASVEYLNRIDHDRHIGFPLHLHGLDLNYRILQKSPAVLPTRFFEEIRRQDHELDDELQALLGARYCGLKAFYPPGGHIGWHTNWNASGYNIIFTFSPNGMGYWRHIDPTANTDLKPNVDKLVHIDDTPGWHCKVGYFGARSEPERVMWHSAFTREPRLTVSYLVQDEAIWKHMVAEIRATDGGEH